MKITTHNRIYMYADDVKFVFFRQLCASPFDKDLLCTCYGTVQENKSRMLCHLWRLGEEGEGEQAPLQDVTPITHQANVRW